MGDCGDEVVMVFVKDGGSGVKEELFLSSIQFKFSAELELELLEDFAAYSM